MTSAGLDTARAAARLHPRRPVQHCGPRRCDSQGPTRRLINMQGLDAFAAAADDWTRALNADLKVRSREPNKAA